LGDSDALRVGDLISVVNRTVIKNLNDYQQALKQAKKRENLLPLVKRGSVALYVVPTPLSNN
jgi:hypothetical protein